MKRYLLIHIKRSHLLAVLFLSALLLIGMLPFFPALAADRSYTQLYPQMQFDPPIIQEQSTEKTAYLTFDDGPSENTSKILDILQKENIPATFFIMLPENEQEEEIIQRACQQGNALGIHTSTHQYASLYASVESYLNDIHPVFTKIEELCGSPVQLLRFPGGSLNISDNTQKRQEFVNEVTRRNFVYFDWNVESKDDGYPPQDPKVLAQRVFDGIKALNDPTQIIILFHDAAHCTSTPQAVQTVITELKNQGYRFEALSPDMTPVQQVKPDRKYSCANIGFTAGNIDLFQKTV